MRLLAPLVLLLAQPVAAQEVTKAGGAKLRLLDKLSGQVSDMVLADGQSQSQNRRSCHLAHHARSPFRCPILGRTFHDPATRSI